MVTILADFTENGAYVALLYETELGFGVVANGCYPDALWFGKNQYDMAREVYLIACSDAGQPTFRNHEAPTC